MGGAQKKTKQKKQRPLQRREERRCDWLNPGGGGGDSHKWAIQVCAAKQGMFFCFSDSGTGYKNRPFSLEQGIFYFRFS